MRGLALCIAVVTLLASGSHAQWAHPIEQRWKSNITRTVLEEFIDRCELTDEQAAQARSAHRRHRSRFSKFVEETQAEIDAQRDRIRNDLDSQEAPRQYHRALISVLLRELEAAKQQQSLDEQVLREWRGLLGDEQRERHWQVFEQWHIRTLILSQGAVLADERLNLIDMIERLEIDVDSVVDSRGRRPLRLLLDEYARKLDGALRALRQAIRDLEQRGVMNRVNYSIDNFDVGDVSGLGQIPDDEDNDMATLTDHFRNVFEHRQNIARINDRFHRNVSAWIPEDELEAYMDEYRRRRGGSLYTGTMAVYGVVADRIEELNDLTDRQREHIEQLRAAYEHRWHRLVDQTLALRDAMHEARLTAGPDWQEEAEKSAEAVQDMYRTQARGIETLLEMLTEDQRSRLTVPEYPDPREDDN